MTTAHRDQDIDLALDDRPQVLIRPAQPYVIAGRVAQGVGVLTLAVAFWGGYTGRIALESKVVPLIVAVLFACGVVAFMFNHRADEIDTPAILIDDQEV